MLKALPRRSPRSLALILAYILILASLVCLGHGSQVEIGVPKRVQSKLSSNISSESYLQPSTTTIEESLVHGQSLNDSSTRYNVDSLQEGTLNEVSSASAVSLDELIITPTKPVRFLRLFSKFQFKGFGFMFAKSLINLQSFGIGIRIPVTANFPKYDQLVYLPRVNSLVGCSYPFHVRWTVSVSLPLQVLLYSAYRCFIRTNDTLSTANFIQRLQNPWYTDSYQRVGVSIAIRYNIGGGFKYTVGPWMNYVPSKSSMEKYAVPLLLTPPAVALTIVNMIHPLDIHIDVPKNSTHSSSNQELVENDKVSEMQSEKLKAKSMKEVSTTKTREALKKKKKTKRIKMKGIRRRGVMFWHKCMKDWTKLKTIAVSCSLGWFRSHHDVFMGSNINFDISAFRPFKTYLERIRRKVLSQIFGSSIYEDEEIPLS